MKASNLLLIVAVVGGALYFGNLAVAANTIDVNVTGFKVVDAFTYVVQLTIQNVSNATINVNSLAGDIFVNNNQLANVSNFTGGTAIPGNSQVAIPITIKPSLLDLTGDVLQVINSGSGVLNFEAKGNMNVNGVVLPFDTKNSISI